MKIKTAQTHILTRWMAHTSSDPYSTATPIQLDRNAS